jgi:hypothetical protein
MFFAALLVLATLWLRVYRFGGSRRAREVCRGRGGADRADSHGAGRQLIESSEQERRRSRPGLAPVILGELFIVTAASCTLDPAIVDVSDVNEQLIARLAYEIELNEWTPAHDGDTAVRPLSSDINWHACASSDPDGVVVEIVLSSGLTSVLLGGGVECGEHDEANHDPRNDRPSFLLVTNDDGGSTGLKLIYRTE